MDAIPTGFGLPSGIATWRGLYEPIGGFCRWLRGFRRFGLGGRVQWPARFPHTKEAPVTVYPAMLRSATYTIVVCANTGQSCVDPDCGCERVAVDVVPLERVRELEAAVTRMSEERRHADLRRVAISIGGETLMGSRESVAKVRAMFEHLKEKARTQIPEVGDESQGGVAA